MPTPELTATPVRATLRIVKAIATVMFILSLAGCGSKPDRVEDVAANNMAADEVTEVMDESMPVESEGSGDDPAAGGATNAD